MALVLLLCSIVLARWIIRPLEESDRQQRQFLSDAGHELKTPVSVVNANAELLSRQIGPNQWLENIQFENNRMADLISHLLLLVRTEQVQIPLEPVGKKSSPSLFSFLYAREKVTVQTPMSLLLTK